jgi:hypothetical protein
MAERARPAKAKGAARTASKANESAPRAAGDRPKGAVANAGAKTKAAAAAPKGSAATAKAKEPPRAPKVTFPKKAQPPTHAEFGARLPAAVGKRFEALRALLKKHAAVEDFYYYGPRTGWAYRYLRGEQSLCSIVILQGGLVGIVALDAAAQAKVAWDTLSDVTRRARKVAHGTPALLWLDIPLDGTGATDFKILLRSKLGG